jgi:hypothetical protein
VSQRRLWQTEFIEGDPIKIGQREFVPIVKMRLILRRQVTFGTEASNGGGGGLVWLQPVSVIARGPDGTEERIPINDETGMAIQWMLIGALVLPTLYLFIASLAFLWRRSRRKQ